MTCVICRIVAGEIPAEVVARTADGVAFLDIEPLADGHTLVVPAAHAPTIEALEPSAADGLFRLVHRLADPVRRAVDAAGTTIGINNGEGSGQTLAHVHVHIVPRWPGDGAGTIHTIFPRRTSRKLADVAAAIRKATGA